MSSRQFGRGRQPIFILDTHQLAQLIAPARQTRADCSNWYAEDCRSLIVAHAFKTHEQDGLPLLLRKLIDSSSEVAQLKHGICVRCIVRNGAAVSTSTLIPSRTERRTSFTCWLCRMVKSQARN